MMMEANNPKEDQFIFQLKESDFINAMTNAFIKIFKEYSEKIAKQQTLELYRREELAKMFKCTPNTISDWVKHEKFPEPIKTIDHTHVWLRSEIEDYILRGN